MRTYFHSRTYLFAAILSFLALPLLAVLAINLQVCCKSNDPPISCHYENINCPGGFHQVEPYTGCCHSVSAPFALRELQNRGQGAINEEPGL